MKSGYRVAPRSKVRARSKVNELTSGAEMGWTGDVSLWVPGQLGLTALRHGGRVMYHLRTTVGTEFGRHSGYDSSWVPWWAVHVNKVVVESRVVCGQNTVESTTWAQICFLKMTFFGLGIHQHFTVSYLYPVHPQRHFCLWMVTKLLLLSRDARGGLLFHYAADVTHLTLLFE